MVFSVKSMIPCSFLIAIRWAYGDDRKRNRITTPLAAAQLFAAPTTPTPMNCPNAETSISLLLVILFQFGLVVGRAESTNPEGLTQGKLGELKKLAASNFTNTITCSISPNQKFAVAVGSKDGSKLNWEQTGNDGSVADRSFSTGDLGQCANYLIDVKEDKILGLLAGNHFGTAASYNHESVQYAWSPDSRWLIAVQSWKWQTNHFVAYRLGENGTIEARLDLKPMAETTVANWLVKRYPKMPPKQKQRYMVTLSTAKIDDKGHVDASIYAEIPKDLESPVVRLSVTAKIEKAPNGLLQSKVTTVKATAADD